MALLRHETLSRTLAREAAQAAGPEPEQRDFLGPPSSVTPAKPKAGRPVAAPLNRLKVVPVKGFSARRLGQITKACCTEDSHLLPREIS
jgi:hypothetical protein